MHTLPQVLFCLLSFSLILYLFFFSLLSRNKYFELTGIYIFCLLLSRKMRKQRKITMREKRRRRMTTKMHRETSGLLPSIFLELPLLRLQYEATRINGYFFLPSSAVQFSNKKSTRDNSRLYR